MNIVLSNTSGVPIYEQIKSQIRANIISGDLAQHELLPSIRGLACDLKISVITTMRAYNDLESEGFIITLQGKGCYVLPQNQDLIREQKLKEIEEHLTSAIITARAMKLSDEELFEILTILKKEI